MKRSFLNIPFLTLLLTLTFAPGNAHTANGKEKAFQTSDRQSYKIYVDNNGVMRRSDNKEEVSYYGTNYTLPFAHAYRAVGELRIDRKDAIDRDVYHLKRLGFNGFRLHLWDVELADSAGNLLSNDHLDLLDYLISQLENEGIDIVLTAQTNFGNGYPEKNIDTGAYSYDYGKCEIHSNKQAQEIQANYLTQLAKHVNPYTGRSYSDDNAIIAIEINNEPCHTDSKKEVTAYINKMVKALKKGGFNKPILYNVSHNPEVTEAYYDADIQGTTYQWYPTGLVAGHQRKGNFLPYVQQYPIPWKDSIKNYDKMARVVYEFDPGDVLYSYLYPTIARTFRQEGFQWITQFAYDPIDIAKYNTEYQTHFLNLAYTPSKAISMLIAGEAARNIPRGTDYGNFPTDTVFGDFTVSYIDDLSLYNTPEKFYYSNSTKTAPKEADALKHIAGVGTSPIIDYNGTGAYFLDEIAPGLWRLELMPDVVITSDPFEKPSLKKEIANIYYSNRPLTLTLPQLGPDFYYQGINSGNDNKGEASQGKFTAYPGVYLLSSDKALISSILQQKEEGKDLTKLVSFPMNNLDKFVAPASSKANSFVIHEPKTYISSGDDLTIEADIIGNGNIEEVFVYPDYVSFWNEDNYLIPLIKKEGNTYRAVIPSDRLGWNNRFGYNIVVKENGNYYTWPQNIEGTPLDWDFTNYDYYYSNKISDKTPLVLLAPDFNDPNVEVAMIPEAWNFRFYPQLSAPIGKDSYELRSTPDNDGKLILRRYIGNELTDAPFMDEKEFIVIKMSPSMAQDGVSIGLIGSNGATYSALLSPKYLDKAPVKMHEENPEGVIYKVPISDLKQSVTNIVPAVFPSFLPREVQPEEMPFSIDDLEFVEMVFPTIKGEDISASIEGIWIE